MYEKYRFLASGPKYGGNIILRMDSLNGESYSWKLII